MGGVSKESGVLKLVRAGGIVELYDHPITAAEVMERYPRHFVTRPDVFKFPYIVVKPESILKPGGVFYIVPYHTIRRLLQSRGHPYHHHRATDYEGVNQPAIEYAQPLIEPNLQRRLIKQSSDKTLYDLENIDTSFFHKMIVPFENSQNKPKIIPRVANFSAANCVFKDGDYGSDEARAAVAAPGCFPLLKKGAGLAEASKDSKATSTSLKPCLRKHRMNKTRSQQGPRVRFKIPDEDRDDDEKWDTDFSEF